MTEVSTDVETKAILSYSRPAVSGDRIFVLDSKAILHAFTINNGELEALHPTALVYSDHSVDVEERYVYVRHSGQLDGKPWFIVSEGGVSFFVLIDPVTLTEEFRWPVDDISLLDCISWEGELILFNYGSPVIQWIGKVHGGSVFSPDRDTLGKAPAWEFRQYILPGEVQDLQFDGEFLYLLVEELATARMLLLKLDSKLMVLGQAQIANTAQAEPGNYVGNELGEFYFPKYWYDSLISTSESTRGYPDDRLLIHDEEVWLSNDDKVFMFNRELKLQSEIGNEMPAEAFYGNGICWINGEVQQTIVVPADHSGRYCLVPISGAVDPGKAAKYKRIYPLNEFQQEMILLDHEMVVPSLDLRLMIPDAPQNDISWFGWIDEEKIVLLQIEGYMYQYILARH